MQESALRYWSEASRRYRFVFGTPSRFGNRRGRFQYGLLHFGHVAGANPSVKGIHSWPQRSQRQPILLTSTFATRRDFLTRYGSHYIRGEEQCQEPTAETRTVDANTRHSDGAPPSALCLCSCFPFVAFVAEALQVRV